MAIPKQVAKKIEEIEKLEQQLAGEAEQVAEVAQEAAPSEEPVAEPVVEEAEQQGVEAESVSKPEPVQEAKPKNTDEDPAVWKQKYKTLQGMYDKEVPQLHSQVKTLTKELETLKESLTQKAEAAPKQEQKLVTDEDVQNFGEDLIEVQRKVAREVAAEFEGRLEALQSENNELRNLLGDTDNRISETTFEARLHRLVPDFQQLDSDPNWIAWLDEVDPVLRAPRRTIALQAYQSGDAEGVAYYVDMFRSSMVKEEPAQDAPAVQELERQIQPVRTAANATPASQKGKTYTNGDIQRMFKKAAMLNSTGKLEEANKLEAEIDAAYMQGRVVA
jgi:hypothetical protein